MIRTLDESPSSDSEQKHPGTKYFLQKSHKWFDFSKRGSTPLIKPNQQIKYHRLYIVAPSPNYYQMDIAFFGGFNYLIMIGVNNRYAWAVEIPDRKKKTIENALEAILSYKSFRNHPITSPQYIYIDCDGERSFSSIGNVLKDYKYGAIKIKINSKPDPYHNRLSIINRLIRTLRDYAHNSIRTGFKSSNQPLPPKLLAKILYFYNHKPHRTLSNLTGFDTSPIDLLNDIDLEAIVAKKLLNANLVYENKRFRIGDRVCVYHVVSNPFEKRRYEMEPGIYKITKRIGNMYKVTEIGVPPGLVANFLIVPSFLLVKISTKSLFPKEK
jgi:hypothetical protein